MDADSARLKAAGMKRELDLGFAHYHGPAAATGARIELIATEHREAFLRAVGAAGELSPG